ncbi:ABC transporter ATP-binding protein [Sedimenticola selenatireducens]|uniref:ABC transporter ATP-binding protein n=1 Tax=Sedimenticola selenatireducens TaxID=191960 RepID=A0A558DXL3_9GAMM|nr:ABC transporter ATP-binding protein [Sedimenticola selenatireducens]TVO70929.1 ABC transporter ATP-binding protein [Sedimenticola selenatireducens]TVT65795.1 MAG: ABC transporter ATP-binding protein [Sedimenticola selenatireducens]
MAALIHISNITRRYGDLCALDDVSFELQPGEVLGFLGPNGAGKSTAMQIICGTLSPTSGQVIINGADLQSDPITAKGHIGYLPETPPLYPDMRVDEYLTFCARLRKIARSQVALSVEKTKQRCGLAQVGSRVIANLSKGYKQRVGIAQAIIHNPRVIVLDEPTSGLDPNQIQEIRDLIKTLSQECGILISTHIMSEVRAICDRVLILHQGRLVYTGPVTTVKDSALLITLGQESKWDYLAQLPGVSHVEPIDQQRFRLTLSGSTSAADIAQAIVAHGDKLYELRPDQGNLEQIFSQLTLGETNP